MKMTNQQKVGAVIVAAGKSQRMGEVDKVLAMLGDKPLLWWTIYPFRKSPLVKQVVVVASEENERVCRQLITGEEWSKVSNICLGGRQRQDSVSSGLGQLKECDWVIIHDGARPLVTKSLIEKGLAAAQETGAAVAAVPVTDTIKVAGDNCLVQGTPPRQNLWAVQTPQVFRFDMIAEAYHQVKDEVTDDATLVEQLGYRVKLYMGSYDNIKVTNVNDLALAEVLLQQHKGT